MIPQIIMETSTTKKPQSAHEKAREEIEYQLKRLDEHRRELQLLDLLCAVITPEMRPTVSYGWGLGSLQGALLHLHPKDIRDALPVLKLVRFAGYKMEDVDDYELVRRRTYNFGKIKVSVFLGEAEGAKCQFKVVGTKTKEEPIYKIVCGDEVVGEFKDEVNDDGNNGEATVPAGDGQGEWIPQVQEPDDDLPF